MKLTELTGQVETHLTRLNKHTLIHQGVLSPFIALQGAASEAGFDLQIASGFRSFERQQLIWNNKYSGKTTLLNKEEFPISFSSLSELERLLAILHWSALPGASRHHWGTDFDIYDPSLLPKDKQLQLTCDEYQEGGYFFKLNQWLSDNMHRYGFYRPYQVYQGGVAAEPWHISYQPIADHCLQQLTITCIRNTLLKNNILGKHLIFQHLPMIYEQYICNINS
ncbi:peptidase M15 [Psychromonas marina]|uniref:Peptidase M15 n=1 Tax=Psychromonas marina TaxID=88364 RepID=A0ABQ6E2S7_9GAMM|nr:M15 family metallopeptidase [Psychromonas marina]GLS91662.1 peptidase M15 [Psychromonas marina]